MRYSLSVIFLLATALGGYAHASVAVPAKAVTQLRCPVRQTPAEVVIRSRRTLLPEARPVLNELLGRAASAFLALAGRKPTCEEIFNGLDTGLARIKFGNAGTGASAGCGVFPGQARNRRAQWFRGTFNCLRGKPWGLTPKPSLR